MPGKQRKISILKKSAELCKDKSHPNFTQANIIRNAHKAGWPENQTTKGTLSKYLSAPETAHDNVPLVFYDVMLDMLKDENIDLPPLDDTHLNGSDLSHVLGLFMDAGEQDQKQARQSLPGEYWSYTPSIEKPGCIVKFLLRIKENREGTLTAEELYYYPKDGFTDVVKQKSSGYIIGKSGHSIMVMKDPSSYLPKVYLMRIVVGPNGKCFSLSGGNMMVNPDIDAVKIMQRKLVCIRSKHPVPTDKEVLIKEHGMGIHSKETEDEVIRGLFETLTPRAQGQAFYI